MLDEVRKFLKETGTTVDIVFDDVVIGLGFPFDDDEYYHNKYTITIKRNGIEYKTSFYDSYHNYIEGIEPNEYDVLSCMQRTPVEANIWDYAYELGYVINSEEIYEKIKKMYEASKNEYENMTKLFDEDEIYELVEITE